MFGNIYQGKTVFVTGHTGFKGAWICEWLLQLGANVVGYALDPKPYELLFDQLKLGNRIAEDHRADILDREFLEKAIKESAPDIVLHLAAQPLVRLSYDIPIDTFEINIMGTAHLLESIRRSGHSCAVVSVTTDKCYENKEWLHAYREEDAMGGHDPYSASKGAAELVIASYRSSFFASCDRVKLASARAGNVIGGGDWAADRIVPDCIRSIHQGNPVPVRNKIATRPWQHVLEPLSGYLWLGACLTDPSLMNRTNTRVYCEGFNFGPQLTSNKTVVELVQEILCNLGGEWIDESDPEAHHEAGKLNLAIDKAFHLLEWMPVWGFKETVKKTVQWYVEADQQGDAAKFTQTQIEEFTRDAQAKNIKWSSNQ